ncbi:FG-GAP and VCBS repeat-containing protein [Streptomyces sp. NPDC058576]|uniref:FG-GAP and VCBS repeat-containing protein n=1 Tax=Streptomyces sp. NPDC058576 TaxID=3346547 RepID=UPI003656D43C
MTSRAIGTGVVLALTLATAVVALPATAHAAPAPDPHGARADFNGDGFPDLAFTAPGATVQGAKGAGYVGVAYGSANGVKDSAKRVFTQASAGVPGSPEAGDAFGAAVTSADLDRDGYADLVVGSPGEKTGAAEGAGGATVLWGGPGGLAAGATLLTGEEYDGLGRGLAVGDFNGDGAPDLLAAGGAALRTLTGPFTRDGAAAATGEIPNLDDERYLDVAAGDVNGDGRDDLAVLVNDGDEFDARRIDIGLGSPAGLGAELTTIKGKNGYRLEGGEHLAVGNVNNDKYADLAVGRAIDGYDSDLDLPLAEGGMLTYVPGGASGPQGTEAVVLNQDSAGVPGAAERSDNFGASVSIGDTDGDGYGEIAVGVPGEDQGTVQNAGGTVVLPGTATGPTGTGSYGFNQGSPDVVGAVERNDRFGGAVSLRDLNGDGRTELAVGAPGENADEGSLWVFPATASGLAAQGSFSFGHGALGTVATKAELGSGFNR